MNLYAAGVYLYVGLLCIIGAIGLITLGFAFYVALNRLIERFERKPMATKMDTDELMLRRLKRSVATRIEQRKMAN